MSRSAFFARRWRADIAVATLWWRDMLLVGTAINLLASFLALMLAAQGAELGVALAVHLAPIPYNLFLLLSLLRHPQRTPPLSVFGAAWFALMLVV